MRTAIRRGKPLLAGLQHRCRTAFFTVLAVSHYCGALSAAARTPDEMAPSMYPFHTLADSDPAQWMRPDAVRHPVAPCSSQVPGVGLAAYPPRAHTSCGQIFSV